MRLDSPDRRPRSSSRGHVAVVAATAALSLSLLGLLFAPRGALRLLPRAMTPDATSTLFVPASAHAAGANGASWRTDLQIHNPGTVTASFTLALLRRDADNSAPETRSFTVAPGQSVRHVDVLTALFGFTGAAALRLDVSSGTLTVTSRTYNQIGENPWSLPEGSSFGQFVPGFPADAAIPYGEEGRLIQLTQRDAASLDGFRTNLGLVNATASILDLKLDLYRADGTWLATKQGDELRLPPHGFRQLDQVFAPWGPLADAYAVVRPQTPGGRLFAFATVIDNHYSGDPIFIPAARVAGAVAPPTATPTLTPTVPGPTATPTRTPTPTPTTPSAALNLLVYKPDDWSSCLVANYRDSCCPPSSELLSSYMDTWLFFPVANVGPARLTGPVSFALSVDGVPQATATWSNDSGLEAGYYTTLKWQYKGTIPIGRHTATIKLDPDNRIPETNESDNSCSFTGDWTSIVFRPDDSAPGPGAGGLLLDEGVARPIRPRAPAASAASTTLYLPASAHADGANGARWRTDAEVHNAGTSQATFTIALLKQNSDNPSPDTRTFTLGPQQSTRFVDVLDSVFGFTGAASLRVTSPSSSLLVTSRTYNLMGPNPWNLPEGASFGQFVNGVAEEQAIAYGEEGRLIQLTHRDASSLADFRTNVGLVNVTGQTLDVRVDLFHADGSLMGTAMGDETRLRPYEFRQLNAVIGTHTSWCADGYAVVRPTTPGGKLLAFATVIDNHYSGDPIFIPAARMTASTPPPTLTPTPPGPTATPTRTPTPGPDVISGPSGSTMTLPSGARSDGVVVSLGSGDGSTLAKPGETLVSPVVKTSVSGMGRSLGDGSFRVTLPVNGTVSDPEKLLLKVGVSTGNVYPVAGVYDAAARTFSAELMGVWDGWSLGVVTRPGLSVTSLARAREPSPLGWVTPTDWQTCTFRVFDETKGTANEAPASFVNGVASAMKGACEHLRGAEFRSPKLWVDGRWNPKARALHIVQGTGANDPTTSFSQRVDENDAAFSYRAFTDEQMHRLGQIYFNWDEWRTVIQPLGWTYANVGIHELFHAVQNGYDFRDLWWRNGNVWYHSAMALTEGSATLLGNVYQNGNGVYGGEVTVRTPEPPEKLSREVLWNCCVDAYERQDFFAYVAKRWLGGSLQGLRWLFQALSDQTDGQFGKSPDQYDTMYRQAMDFHYQGAIGLSLPEVYTELVLDRAYRHNEPALLRSEDRSLKKGSLDASLFDSVPAWDGVAKLELPNVASLAARAVKLTVPDAARAARKLTIDVAVSGAEVSKQGLRLFAFREKDGVMESGGETEITDVTKPVELTVGPETATVTLLVANGSVQGTNAKITLGQTFSKLTLGYSTYTFLCTKPTGCSGWCGVRTDGEPSWGGPLVWAGNAFSIDYPAQGVTVTGEVSADGKTLLFIKYVVTTMTMAWIHWVNLPLDAARSTPAERVFSISGEAARDHVVAAYPIFCDADHSGIDFSKPVVLEVRLGK